MKPVPRRTRGLCDATEASAVAVGDEFGFGYVFDLFPAVTGRRAYRSRYTRGMAGYGSFVEAARRSRGLTQRQVAEISGIEQANISAIENGRRVPSAVTLHRLLHACGYELTATAGDEVIGCRPPSDHPVVDDLFAQGVEEPQTITPDTPMAERVRVITAVLAAAEAAVRSR